MKKLAIGLFVAIMSVAALSACNGVQDYPSHNSHRE